MQKARGTLNTFLNPSVLHTESVKDEMKHAQVLQEKVLYADQRSVTHINTCVYLSLGANMHFIRLFCTSYGKSIGSLFHTLRFPKKKTRSSPLLLLYLHLQKRHEAIWRVSNCTLSISIITPRSPACVSFEKACRANSSLPACPSCKCDDFLRVIITPLERPRVLIP